jgi:hypothetical protein
MYGSNQSTSPTVPPCGLDLRYMDSTAKISFLTYGQVIFRDLAIVDNNTNECMGAPPSGYPFFYITKTVVHFQNVSIWGSSQRLHACNDAFILGSNSGSCDTGATCFSGYGSTFQNLYFSQVRRVALFNSYVNGTDWDYLYDDTYSGNSSDGMHPTGSAIEINCITDHPCVSNVFKNINIEQGPYLGNTSNYLYGLDVLANAGPNFIFGITCFDGKSDVSACVHIASSAMGNEVDPQMVLGCFPYYSPGYNNFPGCVGRDSLGSYRDLVIDPSIMSIFGQTIYGANLGKSNHPFDFLYLDTTGSISGKEGIPSTTSGADTDFLWADSTDHRWKMNNNGSVLSVDVAGTTGATTTNDCAKFDSHGNLVDAGAGCNIQRISCVQGTTTSLSSLNTYYYCNSDLQLTPTEVAGTPIGAACTLVNVYMAVVNNGTLDTGANHYTVTLGTMSAAGGTFTALTDTATTLPTNSRAANATASTNDSLSPAALLAVRVAPPSFATPPTGVQFSVVAFCQ